MKISGITSNKDFYKQNPNNMSFRALKPFVDMRWSKEVWDCFLSTSKKYNIRQDLNNSHSVFEYWTNAIDMLNEDIFKSVTEIQNKLTESLPTEINKNIHSAIDELIKNSLIQTLKHSGLINKINACGMGKLSTIQDRVLNIITGNSPTRGETANVLGDFISLYRSNPDLEKQERIHSKLPFFIENCETRSQLNIFDIVFKNKKLYTNSNLLDYLSKIIMDKNTGIVPIILEEYLSNDIINSNKSINENLGEIVFSHQGDDEFAIFDAFDIYTNFTKSNDNPYIEENIAEYIMSANSENIGILKLVLNSPALAKNQRFLFALPSLLDCVDKRHEDNKEIIEKTLTMYTSTPILYGNKDLTENLIRVFIQRNDKPEALDEQIEVLKKYISDPKYYESILNKIISKVADSTDSNTKNLIMDIMDDIVCEHPKRNLQENLRIIKEVKGSYINSIDEYDDYQKLYDEAPKHINELSSYGNNITPERLKFLFESNREKLSCLLKIAGKEGVEEAYKLKWNNFIDLINNAEILIRRFDKHEIQRILEKMNLKKSDRYEFLNKAIKELKNNYKNVEKNASLEELKNYQNRINTISKELRTLSKKEIKDPYQKILLIRQVLNIKNCNNEGLLNIIDNNWVGTENCNNYLVQALLENLRIPYDKSIAKKLDCGNHPYFYRLLSSKQIFKEKLTDLLMILLMDSEKSVLERLNDLPQNKITKELFKRNKINYERWTNVDNNSFVEIPYGDNGKKLTVRHADMNNVMHSLFLGDYASCCTKTDNGLYSETAPTYIKNKFISAIEILDGNIPVGNTMCYFAKVDDELCLILDNISLKGSYKNSDSIRDGIIKYAKQLCNEVGRPNIPIYTASTRHSVDFGFAKQIAEIDFIDNNTDMYIRINDSDLPKKFQYIGSSGDDYVYIDDVTAMVRIDPDKVENKTLYRLDNSV